MWCVESIGELGIESMFVRNSRFDGSESNACRPELRRYARSVNAAQTLGFDPLCDGQTRQWVIQREGPTAFPVPPVVVQQRAKAQVQRITWEQGVEFAK